MRSSKCEPKNGSRRHEGASRSFRVHRPTPTACPVRARRRRTLQACRSWSHQNASPKTGPVVTKAPAAHFESTGRRQPHVPFGLAVGARFRRVEVGDVPIVRRRWSRSWTRRPSDDVPVLVQDVDSVLRCWSSVSQLTHIGISFGSSARMRGARSRGNAKAARLVPAADSLALSAESRRVRHRRGEARPRSGRNADDVDLTQDYEWSSGCAAVFALRRGAHTPQMTLHRAQPNAETRRRT